MLSRKLLKGWRKRRILRAEQRVCETFAEWCTSAYAPGSLVETRLWRRFMAAKRNLLRLRGLR